MIGDGFADADGDIAAWLAAHGATAVLLRPDFYVYGVAQDARDVAALVAALGSALSVTG